MQQTPHALEKVSKQNNMKSSDFSFPNSEPCLILPSWLRDNLTFMLKVLRMLQFMVFSSTKSCMTKLLPMTVCCINIPRREALNMKSTFTECIITTNIGEKLKDLNRENYEHRLNYQLFLTNLHKIKICIK